MSANLTVGNPYYYTYGSGSERNRKIVFLRDEDGRLQARVEALAGNIFHHISTISAENIRVELLSTSQKMARMMAKRKGDVLTDVQEETTLDEICPAGQTILLSSLKDVGPWKIEVVMTPQSSIDPKFEGVQYLSIFNPS